jgi:hypothetical protein
MYIIFFFFYVFLLPFFLRPKVDVILVFPVGFVTQEKVSFFLLYKRFFRGGGSKVEFLKKDLKEIFLFGPRNYFCFSKKYAKASSGQSW